MKFKLKQLSAVLLFIALSFISYGQGADEERVLQAMHSITGCDLFGYLKEISNDKYEGRLTGTEGYDSSARWLAARLEEWGLTPGGENGSWMQGYSIPYTIVLPDCGVSMNFPQDDGTIISKNYRYITEYMPGSTSGSGTVTGEVVYAGYGITAPELGYDDYAGTDVRGKIVLIEREAPVSPDAGAEKFKPWYEYSFHQSKLMNAVRHGATGMLYNYGPIANPNNAYSEGFVYVHVGDSVVRDIFAGTGFVHSEVVARINKSLRPASFKTGKNVTIKMSTKHFPEGKGGNVIGLLRGSDPKVNEEAIIVGAHLDGLGRCYDIIPGANDNASAVAVMMGVARALSTGRIALRRSVVFIAFGSEEQAIIGSKAYLEKPLFPVGKSVLLNMDGVGIGNSVGVNAGKNFPELYSFIDDANKKYIHRPLSTNFFANLGRPRLDAARFMSSGVPSLSFFTYGSESFYHLPQDDIEIIKPEIMEDLARMLMIAIARIANSDELPLPHR